MFRDIYDSLNEVQDWELADKFNGKGIGDNFTDAELGQMWEELADVPVTEDGDEEPIEENFYFFSKGTPKMDIWHWFDTKHPKGLAVGLQHMGESKLSEHHRGFGIMWEEKDAEGKPARKTQYFATKEERQEFAGKLEVPYVFIGVKESKEIRLTEGYVPKLVKSDEQYDYYVIADKEAGSCTICITLCRRAVRLQVVGIGVRNISSRLSM